MAAEHYTLLKCLHSPLPPSYFLWISVFNSFFIFMFLIPVLFICQLLLFFAWFLVSMGCRRSLHVKRIYLNILIRGLFFTFVLWNSVTVVQKHQRYCLSFNLKCPQVLDITFVLHLWERVQQQYNRVVGARVSIEINTGFFSSERKFSFKCCWFSLLWLPVD